MKLRYSKSKDRYVIDCGKVDGKRKVLYKKDKTEAEELFLIMRKEEEEYGRLAFALSAEERVTAVKIFELLSPEDALKLIRLHAPKSADCIKIDALFEEMVENMKRLNRKAGSITATRASMRMFLNDFGSRHINEITEDDVYKHVQALSGALAPNTIRGRITAIKQLFNFAVRRSYLPKNPAQYIERPSREEVLPEIFEVEQVQRIMSEAEDVCPEACPELAISLWAGLRISELDQLKWEDVKLDRRLIVVRPEVAKSRRSRNVEISDNLYNWLDKYKGDARYVSSGRLRENRNKIMQCLDFGWVHNGCRHSFASYLLALTENVEKVSFQLGHGGSSQMLDTHYRALCTSGEANDFFDINPR